MVIPMLSSLLVYSDKKVAGISHLKNDLKDHEVAGVLATYMSLQMYLIP